MAFRRTMSGWKKQGAMQEGQGSRDGVKHSQVDAVLPFGYCASEATEMLGETSEVSSENDERPGKYDLGGTEE